MQLVRSIGIWYAKRNRRAADDLVSAAYLGLCQAVAWAPERLKDNNITPYIVVTVHRFCREAIEADHTVIVERRARKHYIATRGLPVSREITDDRVTESCADHGILMAEVLDTFCVRHRAVIEMRLAGYRQVEIAEKLRCSQPMVHKYLAEIKTQLTTIAGFAVQIRDML
jgi:RNA polymerase sigma factor (sigma-70 family)